MFILYLVLIVLGLCSSWFILWRVPLIKKAARTMQPLPTFSIIIPARNEEENLPILLESLSKQTVLPGELFVVDDESEDNTAKVASQYGAKMLQPTEAEKEWIGKSAACWYGATKAVGDVFIFLDADIFLPTPDSLENMIETFLEHDLQGVLSIQPYHVIQKPYENLSAIFNLLVLAGMNHFSFLKERLSPAGAFGPSFISSKETYFTLGGHKGVKDELMEHVALGKRYLEAGRPVHLYGGKGSLHFRMYPNGLKSLAEGWSKSFASGSQATHPLMVLGTSLWIAGAFVSFIAPFYFLTVNHSIAFLISLVGYLLYSAHIYRMTRLAGNFHVVAALLYPILFLYFIGLFGLSLIKTYISKEVSWKGRKIKT